MAKSSESKKSKPKKDDKTKQKELLMRIGLYTVLVIVVGVLLVIRQERLAASNRSDTVNAWVDALDNNPPLLMSQLEDLTKGDPVVGEDVEGSTADLSTHHRVYTWKGPFSEYYAIIHYADAQDSEISTVKAIDKEELETMQVEAATMAAERKAFAEKAAAEAANKPKTDPDADPEPGTVPEPEPEGTPSTED